MAKLIVSFVFIEHHYETQATVMGCTILIFFKSSDDPLAIIKVLEDATLSRIDVVPTGGKFPRHFAITPCGKAVIVVNQDSSNLTLFTRDTETGLIEATGDVHSIPAPNYIRFPG